MIAHVPRCEHCKKTLLRGSAVCLHCGTAAPPRATPRQLVTAVIMFAIAGLIIYAFDALKP